MNPGAYSIFHEPEMSVTEIWNNNLLLISAVSIIINIRCKWNLRARWGLRDHPVQNSRSHSDSCPLTLYIKSTGTTFIMHEHVTTSCLLTPSAWAKTTVPSHTNYSNSLPATAFPASTLVPPYSLFTSR